MAKDKIDSTNIEFELENEGNVSSIEGDGNSVKQETAAEPKTIQTFAEVKVPVIEEVMSTTPLNVGITMSEDYKFKVGDDVEVHGLEECRREHIIGTITKLLDGYMYALHGHAYPINKHSIGRIGKIARTFKEVNLRKVTIVHKGVN
jgi:hypothetical protein